MTTATLIDEPSATTVTIGALSFDDKGWQALMAQVECGDYHDNLSVFLTMQYAMRNGYLDEGLQKIEELRTRIIERAESKSSKWLLPELNSYLRAID